MMFKSLCLAALVSTTAANMCGPGTVLIGGMCQANNCGPGTVMISGFCQSKTAPPVARVVRAVSSTPELQTKGNNLNFKVSEGQKVGVQVGEKGPIQYVETADSAAKAVVAAINLGYTMNREVDQMKDMNALDRRLTDLINNVSKEALKNAGDVKSLSSNVDTKLTLGKQATDKALAEAKAKTDADIKAALAAVAKSAKESKETLEKFEKSTKDTVDGLAKAVPAATCANKVKDGDETDVDCGGACGKTCAKGKKCKYSTDCGDSICFSGTCRTCKGVTGIVAISEGVNAYCESNQLRSQKGKPYIQFDTCGKTDDIGPSADDCMYHQTLAPDQYSLHNSFVEYKWGFQILTAPIDGNYKWYMYGAQGGDDLTCGRHHRSDYNRYGKGGQGGRVIATQNNVKANTKFYIRIGQKGTDCYDSRDGMRNPMGAQPKQNCEYNPSGYSGWDNGKAHTDPEAFHQGFGACGGFGGGGPAICNNDPGGASGGGATDIRMCKMGTGCGNSAPTLKQRFLVAGGGGGAAAEGNNDYSNGGYCRWGGHGGGTSGDSGYDNGHSGYGGTQSRGGRHQSENNRDHGSSWGTLGMGGTGGQNDAGGGGGGYYGGGGARYNAGGGGGSSFVGGTSASGKPASVTNNRGQHRGDGKLNLIIYSA